MPKLETTDHHPSKADTATRLFYEAFVIVGSILLAFWIDAAWQNRGEAERRLRLVESIASDVSATRAAIRERERWAQNVVSRARAILEAIRDDADDDALELLVGDLGNVFVKGLWAPINYTYEQAIGSGDLALIEDPDLRLLLGRYTGALASTGRVQDSVITQYYDQLEPYMVANTDYAEIAWDVQESKLVRGPFKTPVAELAASREFYNLLNFKLEIELEVLDSLAAADGLARELLATLER